MMAVVALKLRCEDAPATASAFVARFEADWIAVSGFLEALPRSNLGRELQLRVELEQFGRVSNQQFALSYPEPERETLRTRMWAPVEASDLQNTGRLRELLRDREWFDDAVDGEGSQTAGWLLVQHADAAPDFQREMLDRLSAIVSEGRIRRSEYAMLWDRVAVHEGRPQRFGSQLVCENGQLVPRGGLEDAENLDRRRALFEMQPWASYHSIMRNLTSCSS